MEKPGRRFLPLFRREPAAIKKILLVLLVLVIAICFNEDANAQEKISNSLEIGQVDIAKHDVVFLAGGWGAAWDLKTSDSLGER